MINRSGLLILCALGAGIGPGHATHIGNKAHMSVAEIELGKRLSNPVDAHFDGAKSQVDEISAAPMAPPARTERKVRVVYPLPR